MLGFQKGEGEERTGSFCRLDCFKAGGEGCLDPSTLIMAEVLRCVLYKSWGILFFKWCMKWVGHNGNHEEEWHATGEQRGSPRKDVRARAKGRLAM